MLFGGLKCAQCGADLSFSLSFIGLSEEAVKHDEEHGETNWNYEISLCCQECGRIYPICRTDKPNSISELITNQKRTD